MGRLFTQKITCGYAGYPVLKDVSLSFSAGRLYCLLGKNGAGKSTLVKTLAGQLKPLCGTVFYDEKKESENLSKEADIYRLPHSSRVKLISYVPQEYYSGSFSVLDTVVMGRAAYLGLKSSPEKKDYDIAFEALKTLHIADFADLYFDKLSGGQKRLVLTARAFASLSPVLLLDEPDSGLDIANKKLLYQALKTCVTAGKTVLFTSHDPNNVHFLQPEIVLVSNGSVEFCETLSVQKLQKTYGTDFYEAVLRVEKNEKKIFVPDL